MSLKFEGFMLFLDVGIEHDDTRISYVGEY